MLAKIQMQWLLVIVNYSEQMEVQWQCGGVSLLQKMLLVILGSILYVWRLECLGSDVNG